MAAGLAGVEERQDQRVLKPRRCTDLAEESIRPDQAGDFGPEHLDRDRPSMAKIFGEIDRRHPPRADLSIQPILSVECSHEMSGNWHGRDSIVFPWRRRASG